MTATEESVAQNVPGKVTPIRFPFAEEPYDLLTDLKTNWRALSADTLRKNSKPVHVKGTFPVYLLHALESAKHHITAEMYEVQEAQGGSRKRVHTFLEDSGSKKLAKDWEAPEPNFSCNNSMIAWACVQHAAREIAKGGPTNNLLKSRQGLIALIRNNDAPGAAVAYALEKSRRLDFTIDGSRNVNFDLSEEKHETVHNDAGLLCLDESTTYKLCIAFVVAKQPNVSADHDRERAADAVEEYQWKAAMAGRSALGDLEWCLEQTAIRALEREQLEAKG